MAIAPLMEYQGLPDGTCGLLERPWPRAELRVVPAVPALVDVVTRRTRRVAAVRRRRRVLLCTLVAGLVVLLALPLGALGGAAPAPTGGAVAAGVTVYVVQPGDTLWSIASRFDRGGDPRPLAEAIAEQTHSMTVVPGERIAIP
ncbi:MAG: LysM peptidoglycan-binding domain-containing protein [Acidimicrobiales bacterium]